MKTIEIEFHGPNGRMFAKHVPTPVAFMYVLVSTTRGEPDIVFFLDRTDGVYRQAVGATIR